MTSKKMRETPRFLRNEFETEGQWDIPIVKKQLIPISEQTKLIPYSKVRTHESEKCR